MRGLLNVLIMALMAGVTAGVLIPAVVMVRDAASRMTCKNNLRQLGFALRNHQDTYQHFPRAAEPNPDLLPEQCLSWLVSVEPYVEASNLTVRLDRQKGWAADENRHLALTTLKYLHCPAYP